MGQMESRLRSRKGRRLVTGTSGLRTGRIDCKPGVRLREGEDGQVLVEFALLAPLLLLIVVGIVQFGVALNYWLDMQRIANQGARWAVVNAFPVENCRRGDDPADCPANALQDYLASAPVSGGLKPDVEICFEDMSGPPSGTTPTPAFGDPVTVRLTTEFEFVPMIRLGSIDLEGAATMRVEQKPSRYSAPKCPTGP